MNKSILRRALALILCVALLPTNMTAKADSLKTTGNEIVAGIAAVGAAIVVVAIVLVVHYKPATVKGCVATGPNGLELMNSSDNRTYDLAGVTSDIKPGEMVKVKGKKKSGKGGAPSTFTVKELGQDYGACPAGK
jgi:hypothetical protein